MSCGTCNLRRLLLFAGPSVLGARLANQLSFYTQTHTYPTLGQTPLAAVAAALVATLRIRHVGQQLSCLRIGRHRCLGFDGEKLGRKLSKAPKAAGASDSPQLSSTLSATNTLIQDANTHTHTEQARPQAGNTYIVEKRRVVPNFI